MDIKHEGALEPGKTYQVTQEITLPENISGDVYFFVRTDLYDAVFEGALNSNNTGFDSTPTRIQLAPPPDLSVESVTIAEAVSIGEKLKIDYTVVNSGEATKANASWLDTFYLSSDNTLDLAIALYLGGRTRTGGLAAGESYNNSAEFTLIGQLPGEYFVTVVADNNNNIVEVDNGNNSALSAAPVVISPQKADFLVSNIAVAEGLKAGESTQVMWTVENQGTGQTLTNGWRDRIVLSKDSQLGNADDIVLKEVVHTGNLAANETYSETATVDIPADAVGDYSVFVVSDAGNAVDESNEDNNAATQSVVVNRKTPDLQVVDISSEAESGAVGTDLTVSWKVQNTGDGSTKRDRWYDHVYLSTDQTQGAGDILGRVLRETELVAGGQYIAERTFTIPENAVGDFYLIVRTDADDEVLEGIGEENNDGVSAIALSFTETAPSSVLSFSEQNYTVRENGTAVTEITIVRTGNAEAAVSGEIALIDGSATGCGCGPDVVSDDFHNAPIAFTLAVGETRKVIAVESAKLGNPNAIRIRNDSELEGPESFTISLRNLTNGATVGNVSSAVVNILDDDADTKLSFGRSSFRVQEMMRTPCLPLKW